MTRKRIKTRHQTTIKWNFTTYDVKGLKTNLPVIIGLDVPPHLIAAKAYSVEDGTRGKIRLTFANPENLGVYHEHVREWNRVEAIHALHDRMNAWNSQRISDHSRQLGDSQAASDMHGQVIVDLPFILTRDERQFTRGVYGRMQQILGSLGIHHGPLHTCISDAYKRTEVWDKTNGGVWVPYCKWSAHCFLEGLDVA